MSYGYDTLCFCQKLGSASLQNIISNEKVALQI